MTDKELEGLRWIKNRILETRRGGRWFKSKQPNNLAFADFWRDVETDLDSILEQIKTMRRMP